MHQEALQRLNDAKVLSGNTEIGPFSNSSYLLELLGLELLLKLVYEVTQQGSLITTKFHHNYDNIFSALPQECQTILLEQAQERIGCKFNVNHIDLLQIWGSNFIKLRYPYEKYNSMSEAEYIKLSETWIRKGAPGDEADFRFYPEELFGFIFALTEFTNDIAKTHIIGPLLEIESYPNSTCTKLSLNVVECPISPNSAELIQFTVPSFS